MVRLLLCLFGLVKFLSELTLTHPLYELHRDELLYLAEARHLAWGYLEAPPLLSLLASLSLLSDAGEYAVRCWPALFGAATFLIAGKIVLDLGGKGFALFLLFLAFIFTAFLRIHFLFQPNFLDVFFWTLAAYWVFCYIRRRQNRFIYLLGVTAGLGMLSKYSMAIFLLALIAALAISAERKLFARRHVYLAALAGLLIALPNFIWQYQHNFPIINHMEELHQTQLRHIDPVSFLIEQLLLTLPVVFVWLAGLWQVFTRNPDRKYIVFGWTYLLIILLLLALHGKAYYALGIYPVLLAFGAFFLENISRSRPWVAYVCPLVILVAGLPMIPVLLPVWEPATLAAYYRTTGLDKAGILRWEDLKDHQLPQDFADMLGRKELTSKTLAAYERIPAAQRQNTVIFCDNYGQAGGLNYYGSESALPRAVSASASFVRWIPRYERIEHLIWVSDEEFPGLRNYFSEVIVLDSVADPMAREFGTKIRWFRNADSALTPLLNAMTAELQERWQK